MRLQLRWFEENELFDAGWPPAKAAPVHRPKLFAAAQTKSPVTPRRPRLLGCTMSTATLIPPSAPHHAGLPVRISDVAVIARWRAIARWENEGGNLPCVARIRIHGRGRAGDSVAKT